MSVGEKKKALKLVHKTIKKACKKAGRDPGEVRILVITRNRRVPEIRELIEAGATLFGENRVQEAIQKISFFEEETEWHLVGHLQSVKAKVAIQNFKLIHTVDSLRIGFDLQRACEKLKKEANILIQINTTGMDEPFGVEPPETIPLIKELIKFPLVHIRGLMTQVPQLEEPEQSRPYFKKLHDFRDQLEKEKIPGVDLKWLVMGTSWDYAIAVEEGANIVKITSPIFPEE